MLLAGLYAPASFMSHFIVFVLSVFVGVPGDLERQPFAAHAADGGHERDFVDHHPGRADADRVGQLAGRHPGRTVGLHGGDQHFRWLHGHPAHARHVPEVVRGARDGLRIYHGRLCRCGGSLHPVAGRAFGAGKRQARRLVWHRRHGAGRCGHALSGRARATG